jgi:DNA-binding MarR family transcriptional regulator
LRITLFRNEIRESRIPIYSGKLKGIGQNKTEIRMPNKSIFDISCENADLYFDRHLPQLTPEAKDGLPRDIIFKIFRKGGVYNSKSTSKLSFLAKLYIMVRSLKKRWYLVIEDEENGIGLDQFKDINQAVKDREYSVPNAERFLATGSLILANKELSDTFSYLNRLCMSPAANYLLRAKNSTKNRTTENEKAAEYVVRFLVHWEGIKKELVSKSLLSIPEVLVLLALYKENELKGSVLYHGTFKRAYQSSPGKIKAAFRTLHSKGYIIKFGVTSDSKVQITPLGREILRGILDKYVVNC